MRKIHCQLDIRIQITDSICSAICYANLKRILTGEKFTPARAGHVNSETQYVLDYFWSGRPPSLLEKRADSGEGY